MVKFWGACQALTKIPNFHDHLQTNVPSPRSTMSETETPEGLSLSRCMVQSELAAVIL